MYKDKTNTDTAQTNTTDTEQTSGQRRTDITPVLPLAGQKFPRYSEGYVETFRHFRMFVYCMIFEEPLTTLCRNLRYLRTLTGKTLHYTDIKY
jgi:hypothetical protein